MTRTPPETTRRHGRWPLQDAKARFSELVRLARSDGPQRVTVHGRDEVVVISVAEFDNLSRATDGRALVAAMQAMPHDDLDLEFARQPMPVRDVVL